MSIINPAPLDQYVRYGLLVGIRDADTVVANIDLGLHVWHNVLPLRIHNLWCPERDTPEGQAGTEYIKSILTPYATKLSVWFKEKPKPSYDRTVADVWFLLDTGWYSYADRMVEKGYGTRKNIPSTPLDTNKTSK